MKYLFGLLLLLFQVTTPTTYAQTAIPTASLQISGEGLKTLSLSEKDLMAMKSITVDVKGHDEKQHTYTGVLLTDILNMAGAGVGEPGKKNTITSYVLVTAADKYKVIYALAELDPLFTDKTIILAFQADGKPLDQKDGPFQVIVPGEKRHARWIRQIVSIKLIAIP
ncbi:molybdopterin-binding protein [Adhaeribacter arboris]|uniref:Molybdopterin-binding protein n=1 Tax=Adhaeribacter arboris TaxID=2072846 RepID=A0A2T2YEI1_9BACT|nr:molybdopterin-dependent oxidoreductase [Adhaeribacter arboris]PSR53925.1 molybdopterin-binding protein [Adhaeribacter arboris]